MSVPKLILLENIQHLGWPGLSGVVFLLASLAYGVSWVLPVSQNRDQVQLKALQAETRLAGLADMPAGQTATQSPEQQYKTFYQSLTTENAVSSAIERVYAAAGAERISLERGEYAQASIANTRLARYQIVLPIRADYSQIRRFVDTAIASVPGLNLDDISLQRKNIAETQLEARLQFSLYLSRS